MTVRNITSRGMLNLQTRELLTGRNDLTPEARFAQVIAAQQVRNFWFTATLEPSVIFPAIQAINIPLVARTPALSNAVVVTDVLSLTDFALSRSQTFLSLEVTEFGGQERSQGLNYFGLSGPVPQRYILNHEKNTSTVLSLVTSVSDLQGRSISYLPRLLAPYQQLQFRWITLVNAAGVPSSTAQLFLQAGLRALRHWPNRLAALPERHIRDYIKGSRPETFLLEATLPLANFPATGTTVQIKTPQMDRPLLVLGAASNVEGCQGELEDESDRYVFTLADTSLAQALPAVPNYKAPPLALWAPNVDFRNANLYNMFPVPHLLKPGAQLVIRLTNGLRPAGTGAFEQTMLTRSEQDARIVFICRTV